MPLQKEELNFLMIPLIAPGHILPMVDMAKLLARQGVTVTIITTTMNARRIEAVIDRAAASGLRIRLLQVPFPSEEVGLPKGCECADDLPSYDLLVNIRTGIQMLQHPIGKMIEELNPSPSCIIGDKHFPWVAEVTRKYRIPWISFDGMSCFTQVCANNLRITKVHETTPEGQPFVIPDLPDKIELTKSQLPGFLIQDPNPKLNAIRERVRAGEMEAYGMVVNSCEELEGNYAEEFRKLKGGKVWCIGPLSLINDDNIDKAQRGSNVVSGDEEQRLMKWLGSWKPGTVVYACLGSLSRLTLSEFIELASGLEASNHPFILLSRSNEQPAKGA
ncbi:OLC1v1034425C1 [Oldenlandia corymbosa var. corymbosa]|uniref:OLC1v1034425C1 n=1 Tax=Oldenlandia corymbosa var. corymbosa TaxID=529605 RepID=A0AAV1CR97_OLDCO|nr:OLC1v1034425C1 [Oldenlandia corymbosa var. corymbosa]